MMALHEAIWRIVANHSETDWLEQCRLSIPGVPDEVFLRSIELLLGEDADEEEWLTLFRAAIPGVSDDLFVRSIELFLGEDVEELWRD